jgi:hypothetical protein
MKTHKIMLLPATRGVWVAHNIHFAAELDAMDCWDSLRPMMTDPCAREPVSIVAADRVAIGDMVPVRWFMALRATLTPAAQGAGDGYRSARGTLR